MCFVARVPPARISRNLQGAKPLKQLAWVTAGMAFFWPFIKGPFTARFLAGADQGALKALGAAAMVAAFLCLAYSWMRVAVRLFARERAGEAHASPAAARPSGLPQGATIIALLLSYLLSFAVELPSNLAPEPAATALAALLPALSALCLARWHALTASDAGLETADAPSAPVQAILRRPRLLVGLVSLIYAASGVMSGIYSASPVQGSVLSACLAAPLLACAALARTRPSRPTWLWGITLVPLIMSALCVMVPSGDVFAVGLNILTAGRRGVFMLAWPLLAQCVLARGGQRRTCLACSAGYVLFYLLVRVLINVLRAAGVETALSPETLQLVTLAVGLVIVACSLAVIALAAPGHPADPAAAGEAAPATSAPAPTERELRQAACRSIAEQAGLTQMEERALEYVSAGYTVARIAQERNVSENTVRTHTKGLYRKLDVHSKQQVIELVEAEMARTRE